MKPIFMLLLLLAGSLANDSAMEEGQAFNFLTEPTNDFASLDNGPEDKPMDLDGTIFEAHASSQFDAAKPVSLDNNQIRNDEDFVRNSIPELKQRDMDVDKFIDEFDRIDCAKNNGDENDPLNLLCDNKLISSAFAPLGEFNTDHNNFYDYLREQIYQPLAYDIRKRESISDMLIDTMNLSHKASIFNGKPLMTNYNKFESTILNFFEDIAGKSNDMEANKDAINENIISILKRFHLYWNFLRYRGQFDKLKIDTREIVRTLLKSYMMKRDFLNYVAKTLIKGIVKAYYRFVRAHKMIEVLNKYGPELLVQQIVNRYKAAGNRIKIMDTFQVFIVKEVSYMISLLQVYHVLSYKQGHQDSLIQNSFQTHILKRIQAEYDYFDKYLKDEPDNRWRLKQIRDFTAVLLLKFKHISFIIFNYHGISQYANLPQMNYIKAPFAIKIYYEILDNMMMIPKTCANFLLIKNCVIHETTKVLRFVTNKYMLKRSTVGWYFLTELNSMMKSMYSLSDQSVWENWDLFKNYFYQNLFSVMYTYKKMFQVSDMDAVENLENLISAQIDALKAPSAKPETETVDFEILDQLDKEVYNEFLSIKADYNDFVPIETNAKIKSFIQKRLAKFLINFKSANKSRVNNPFIDLLRGINNSVKQWIGATTRELELSYHIGPPNVVPTVQNLTPSKDNEGNAILVQVNNTEVNDGATDIFHGNQAAETNGANQAKTVAPEPLKDKVKEVASTESQTAPVKAAEKNNGK
ncbi:MAG: hypothetical protein IM572_06165 [Chitinophagaceae bacterium]|nr:hypothetical protein [Chitinophagaceae bacterium]